MIFQLLPTLVDGIHNHTFLLNSLDVTSTLISEPCIFEFVHLFNQWQICEEYWKYSQEGATKDFSEPQNNAGRWVSHWNSLTRNRHRFCIKRITHRFNMTKSINMIFQNIEEGRPFCFLECSCNIIQQMTDAALKIVLTGLVYHLWIEVTTNYVHHLLTLSSLKMAR